MEDNSTLRAFDVARALAFVCDLSMGQPTDHSLRTAWLARQLAIVGGLDAAECNAVCEASLLRWSGCTANASDFAELLASTLPVGKPWSPCGRYGQVPWMLRRVSMTRSSHWRGSTAKFPWKLRACLDSTTRPKRHCGIF